MGVDPLISMVISNAIRPPVVGLKWIYAHGVNTLRVDLEQQAASSKEVGFGDQGGWNSTHVQCNEVPNTSERGTAVALGLVLQPGFSTEVNHGSRAQAVRAPIRSRNSVAYAKSGKLEDFFAAAVGRSTAAPMRGR